MTRESESLRLKKIAVESGGYVANPCSLCSWWKLERGNKRWFERDYHTDIRCKCTPSLNKSKGRIETMLNQKIDKPLYHGTSNAASIFIVGGNGFKSPVYLTANKERAIHYAKAATAYLEKICEDEGVKPIAEGYALFTFNSLPNPKELRTDDYNLDAEPAQFIYQKPIRGLRHYTVERHNLEIDEAEHLRLVCFAIGMWSK